MDIFEKSVGVNHYLVIEIIEVRKCGSTKKESFKISSLSGIALNAHREVPPARGPMV